LYLSDEVVDFSSVSFGRGSSQINITGLIGDVFVHVFKMIFRTSDTASAHAGSPHARRCRT